MGDALGLVIFGVVAVAVVIGLATVLSSRTAYDEIGRDGLFDGTERPADEGPGAPGGPAARDEEIRQMLHARNVRRQRRGEAPLNVEDELAALQEPVIDDALLREVREHVEARNARRVRQGKPPLDVEAEVARQIGPHGRGSNTRPW